MSSTDAPHDHQHEHDGAAFADHDFGGDAAPAATPEHVEPYSSHDVGEVADAPQPHPDHVDPYSSRD